MAVSFKDIPPEEMLELPLEQWPSRVSRWKRRKGETKAEFVERCKEGIRDGALTWKIQVKASPLGKRSPELQREIRDTFELTQEDLEFYAEPYPRLPSFHRLQTPFADRRAATWDRDPLEADGLLQERLVMSFWIEDTYTVKRSEAFCNLRCYECPSAQLLSCASDNQGPAEKDGVPLISVLRKR